MSLLEQIQSDSRADLWIRAYLDHPYDWCLIWPFSRSQTGYAMVGADSVRVHRVMCEHRNGPAPTPEHYAAHSCDRGHEGCVNQLHLSWKTPSENQYDRFKNGEIVPQRKLTVADAQEIRNVKGLEPILDTATRFGVSESNVRLIQAGKTWRKDRKDRHIFTRNEILRIRSASQADGVTKAFAKEFGVSLPCIQRIRNGTFYKHVTPEPAQRSTGGEG